MMTIPTLGKQWEFRPKGTGFLKESMKVKCVKTSPRCARDVSPRDYTPGSTNIAGWKMDPLKMYFLLKMGIVHCYVS